MSGIVNSTGARSGVVGTTVGTPVSTASVLQVVGDTSDTVATASASNVEGALAVSDIITTTVLNSKIFMTGNAYMRPNAGRSSLAFFRNVSGTRTLLFTCSTSDRLSPLDGWYGALHIQGLSGDGNLDGNAASFLYSPSAAAGTAITIEVRGLAYRTNNITIGYSHGTHLDAKSSIILMEIAP